jgi:hypothetical protein
MATRSSRRTVTVAAVLAAVLVTVACSDDDPEPTGAPAPTPTTEEGDPFCPLTGEEPPARLNPARPAVAVKIENDPAARPQAGLEDADLVFEERVEGGITRFLVVYHCGDAEVAGPIRSGRFDDPKIAKPYTSLLAASGSNNIVEREMSDRGMVYLDEDSTSALFRVPAGSTSVHSLFADTRKLRREAMKAELHAPAADVFAFSEEVENESRRARSVKVNFTASNTIEYRWMKGAWARFEAGVPFMARSGEQITVPNLLVQEVRVDNSRRIVDSAGNPSPIMRLRGRGRALLFRDGRVVRGQWRIRKTGRAPEFTDRSGKEFSFAPGPIWVELVPSARGGVTGSVSFSARTR